MRLRFLSLVLPLFAACTVESGSSGDSEARGSLGKADLVGTCHGKHHDQCGGKGKGNCWCDEACVDFGDCCADAESVCGIEQPEPEEQSCGGLLGLSCDEGEYCSFAPEQSCGAADQTGVCLPRPEVCIQLYKPVCGCDGETYGNSCHAAGAGTSVAHEGPCDVPSFCGGFANIQCPEGQTCVDDPNDDCDPQGGGADCGGICQDAAPVDPCDALEAAFTAEVAQIRACTSADECGQVLTGTSCGCTHDWVARTDADLGSYEGLRAELEANGCALPGGISTCDCPPADGFACTAGVCGWNYGGI